MNLKITSPVDPFWGTNDAGKMNIHRNKGTGIFLYAVFDNDSYVKLAAMEREHSGFTPNAETPYYVTLLNLTGNDNYLQTNETGNIVYHRANGTSTDQFTVEADGTVRPGDDYYLCFKYLYFVSEPQEGDFFAAYDRIMLDRANQYIDERIDQTTGEATGIADWNENQIDISEWTKWNDNSTIYGSVAYNWHGCDSVEDFNADLEERKAAIIAWHTVNPYTDHPEFSTWNSTSAPNNTWGLEQNNDNANYRFGITPSVTTGAINHAYDPLVINNQSYFPYTPGFGIKRSNHDGEKSDAEYAVYSRYGAGVDCTGYIQRCASYPNNPYKLTDNTNSRLVWGTTWSWGLVSKSNPNQDKYVWSISANMRPAIVPGDLLLRDDHAVMILRIEYSNNSRTVLPENVTVIEAAGWDQKWRVMNDNTWEFISEDNNFYPYGLQLTE